MTNSPDTATAQRFADLHKHGCFIMPNAWNGGSAKILSGFGFPALGTTSAGLAFNRGHGDQAALLPLDDALANVEEIADAVSVPISADFENGYADSPDAVAANIRRVASAGAAGASIEDHTGDAAKGLYDIGLAVERIAAAVEAARGLSRPFVVTARAECYLVGNEANFGVDLNEGVFPEAMKRLKAYAEAGADCVYAPGVRDRDEIKAFVDDTGAPVNVLVGIPGMDATLGEMADLGVRRLSTGGSLMRSTLNPLLRACSDMQAGRFPFPDDAPSEKDLLKLFESGG